jgi:hypothetical protein
MAKTFRRAAAILASIPLGILLTYFGLVAVLTIVQQVLAGLFDLGQATWTSFLNPAYILGFQSLGGTGNVFDALVGGAGAPGGSANRYFVFMVSAFLAAGAFVGLKVVWAWATSKEEKA